MTVEIYTGLTWLTKPPADFAALCKAAAVEAAPGRLFRSLSDHALDENQLSRLGRAITRATADGRSLAPLEPFRLGVIGNATLDLMAPARVASAARHGVALECILADYAQTTQEALDPASRINRAKPDVVLLAIDHRGCHASWLESRRRSGPTSKRPWRRSASSGRVGGATRGAVSIVQTIAPPPETLFGG